MTLETCRPADAAHVTAAYRASAFTDTLDAADRVEQGTAGLDDLEAGG